MRGWGRRRRRRRSKSRRGSGEGGGRGGGGGGGKWKKKRKRRRRQNISNPARQEAKASLTYTQHKISGGNDVLKACRVPYLHQYLKIYRRMGNICDGFFSKKISE